MFLYFLCYALNYNATRNNMYENPLLYAQLTLQVTYYWKY